MEKERTMRAHLLFLTFLAALISNPDWPYYGGGPEQNRYSTLTQITRANVQSLRVAWTYDTKDAFQGSEMQCQPVVAHGTGKPITSFGGDGRIDLREGFEGRDPRTLNVGVNTPGVFYRDLLILGSIVPEGLPSAPGDIRACDINTGKQRWAFHTIPHPGELGYDTWPADA